MNNQLSKLTGRIKVVIGTLISSKELELTGVADLARARARRNTQGKIRLTTSSFRESVGQMTANERLAAESKADRPSIRSAISRRIAALLA